MPHQPQSFGKNFRILKHPELFRRREFNVRLIESIHLNTSVDVEQQLPVAIRRSFSLISMLLPDVFIGSYYTPKQALFQRRQQRQSWPGMVDALLRNGY